MRKLTKQDLQDLQFDGIIVGVPIIGNIKEGQYDDIIFIVECNYYTNGKHGYKEPGCGCDNSSFYQVAYNMDCLPNGLWMNATSRFTIEHSFRFDSYAYYKFDDMEEFCIWFLQRNKYEIWSTSGDLKGQIHEIEPRKETTAKIKEDKEWIHEKCGTNTPPTSVPKHPSKGNKKSSFLDINELKIDEIAQCVLKHRIREELQEVIQKDKFKELNKINSESIYWDIYCEEETTPEIKEKIEEIYPYFKEQYAKSYLQYDGNEYKTVKDIYTQDEIREKVNPGWKTRRQKYGELITLMDLYWNWVKECIKPGAAVHDFEPAHTKLEEFLNGEANE